MKFSLLAITLSALALVAASPVANSDSNDVAERGFAEIDESFHIEGNNTLIEDPTDPANPNFDARDTSLEKRRSFTGVANPPAGVPLKCRKGPYQNKDERHRYNRGDTFKIKCQILGQSINGNAIWNHIDRSFAPDCFVSDYYTKTGYKWIPGVPRC